MSIFKDDINAAKERLKAWWDHELLDRPCIYYYYPLPGVRFKHVSEVVDYFMSFYLAEFWDDIGPCLDHFEESAKKIYFGGDSIPRFFPNYGAGAMAAILGIEPKFMVGTGTYGALSKTVWFHRDTSVNEIIPLLESAQIDKNNPWYARFVKIIEYAAKRAGKNYTVGMTDLGGILDILSSFLGSEKIILTMKRQPEIIDTCRAIILDKWMKVYKDLQNILDHYGDGCDSWLNVWCPRHYYPIQSDFIAMLNPKWFKRFVLPDLILQSEQLDYAIFHLDGPNALVHLDDLLKIPSIHGIQWVPGAGRDAKYSETWMPIYKKIQAAGKNLVINNFEDYKYLNHFYKELEPKGLYISTFTMDRIKAQFYLPEFIGGKGGRGDFKKFKKKMRKTKKKTSKLA